MRLIRTFALFCVTFVVFSCGLNDEYDDKNITIEITGGTPQEPGIIEITSNIEDTIRMYYSVEYNSDFEPYTAVELWLRTKD